MKTRIICSLLCSVLAVGGCPQGVSLVAKTAADYNGKWHVVATAGSANFCLLIAEGQPVTADAHCDGQSAIAVASPFMSLAGSQLVVAFRLTVDPQVGPYSYNLGLTENQDGSLAGNMHVASVFTGSQADTPVVLTRE